jgi:hypothetical protein
MPVEGCGLVIEPTYPKATELTEIAESGKHRADDDGVGADEGITVRNHFWSTREHAEVFVFEDGGKVQHVLDRQAPHHLALTLGSLSCADAWGIEQEQRALKLLGTLVKHRQFKQYLLTGMFIEQSRRSGVHYIFRRLRPTVAFTMRGGLQFRERPEGDYQMKILCSLCMHPIAYYEGSWGGAMCPTDDIVAHLSLMRGDERLFWARSNQHPAWRREAGI